MSRSTRLRPSMNDRSRVSRMRCTADPGWPQTGAVLGLQRTTTQSSVRRLRKLICVAALRPRHGRLILQQLERCVEDLAGVGVALAFHLLYPLAPDRLAGEFGPARQLVGRNGVAIELVV